jgi:hypothetical protein
MAIKQVKEKGVTKQIGLPLNFKQKKTRRKDPVAKSVDKSTAKLSPPNLW